MDTPFTGDEIARIEMTLFHDSAGAFLNEYEHDVIYSWLTTCWKCEHQMWVWFENVMGFQINSRQSFVFRPLIARSLPAKALASFGRFGFVTTAAGGTYRGFTCPCCDAVQGRHFLRQELYRHIVDGTIKATYFGGHDVPSRMYENTNPADRHFDVIVAGWR